MFNRLLIFIFGSAVIAAFAVPNLACSASGQPTTFREDAFRDGNGSPSVPYKAPQIEGKQVTVGDPGNPDSLGRSIQDAYDSGARVITLRKGVYEFRQVGRTLINLDHWRDARIDGDGSTLISAETNWGNEIFHLESCINVQVVNFTLSQTWQTALQGKVLSVDQVGHRTVCVWRPDAGYASPGPFDRHFNKSPNIVDGKTRKLKHGCGDEWDADIESLGNGTWRVSFQRRSLVAPGDWLVARGAVAPCKVHLVKSHNCLISGITLWRNAFAAILENDGGGNHFYDCVWDTGPKLYSETEEPLVSCSVDGFHSNGANPGPDLERCDFNGVLLDDCIAIHGDLQQVTASTSSGFVVDKDGGHLAVGQPIRIGAKDLIVDAKVTSIQPAGNHTVRVEIDKPISVPVGAMVGNPLWNGAGFRVIGCHLGNTRSRGMLVKGDAGIITNNIISACGMSGVSAGPDYPLEGDFVEGLTIKRNRFDGNGFVGQDLAAIQIHGGESMGNRDIVIQDNEFLGNYSGDIDIHWAHEVSIGQNRFSGPLDLPSDLRPPRSIRASTSSNVRIVGSIFSHKETYREPVILATPDVKGFISDDH